MICAFDCDGCLIQGGKPIEANIALLKVIAKEHPVIVWSGNGWRYALEVVNKYHLPASGVMDKYGTFRPDIAFDDKPIDLGKLNICVS